MLSYLIPQKWYLILQKESAEIFIYQWGRLTERCFLKTPLQLSAKCSLSCPTSVTIFVDHMDEILEARELPKTSFLDRKLLLINYLKAKFPSESWFGGMYLKNYRKKHPFLGIAFQEPRTIMAWMMPLQEKGIRVHLTCLLVEAQNFLRRKLEKTEAMKPFMLLMPWNDFLKQILFLNGEIRYLRTIKRPSSIAEYNHEITSFSYYVKRQNQLPVASLPVIYVKIPRVREIPENVKKIIEIQDISGEIISYIRTHRLSQFRMLKFSSLGVFSYKQLIYKYGIFFFLSFTILGTISLIKGLWTSQDEQKVPQKQVLIESSTKSVQSPVILYLAAIFYRDEKTWTLWFNGLKVTDFQGIKELGYDIVHVTEHQVTLRETDSKKATIILKPNQTFIAQEGCVKEGNWQKEDQISKVN